MTPDSPRDWKHIAEQASAEMNSEKLMELVDELNQLLREHEDSRVQRHRRSEQL